MLIKNISFGNITNLADYKKQKEQKGASPNYVAQTPAADTFTRTSQPPLAETPKAPAIAVNPQNPVITKDNPIYYVRIFERLTNRLEIKDKSLRITPEEAAKELIETLKDKRAIESLFTAYENKQYKEVGAFIDSLDALDIKLHDSKLSENTYLGIQALLKPVQMLTEDFDTRQDIHIPQDDEEEDLLDQIGYFIMEGMVDIEKTKPKEEIAESWDEIETALKLAHRVEEFPRFQFSITSSPNIKPEDYIRVFTKYMELISRIRKENPCNPENYIPEYKEDKE